MTISARYAASAAGPSNARPRAINDRPYDGRSFFIRFFSECNPAEKTKII